MHGLLLRMVGQGRQWPILQAFTLLHPTLTSTPTPTSNPNPTFTSLPSLSTPQAALHMKEAQLAEALARLEALQLASGAPQAQAMAAAEAGRMAEQQRDEARQQSQLLQTQVGVCCMQAALLLLLLLLVLMLLLLLLLMKPNLPLLCGCRCVGCRPSLRPRRWRWRQNCRRS